MSFVYMNGQYLPDHEAKISVFDRSYLFGEGVFETLRSYNGHCLFLQHHLNRLEWAATFLEIEFPSDLNFAEICENLLQKSGFKEAKFKIILSQNDQKDQPGNVVIFCFDLAKSNDPTTYRLKNLKNIFNDALPFAALKTTNYLSKIYAKKQAQESGYNDAILINAQGRVTEATTGNLFWVDKDHVLHTVIESDGHLNGTMQKVIFDLLTEHKLHLKKSSILADELTHSREVFLTNAVVGIKPVVQIDQRQISGGEVGSITAMLQSLLQQKITQLLKSI